MSQLLPRSQPHHPHRKHGRTKAKLDHGVTEASEGSFLYHTARLTPDPLPKGTAAGPGLETQL